MTILVPDMLVGIHALIRRGARVFFAACLGLGSCTGSAAIHPQGGEPKDELARHIRYLSQPALKGRKTRSAGARLARRYIEDRFQACGLAPWGKENSYELSFRLGKNVVGILPGSDANLAGEIVLLSAHYDHLGKDRKGRICPGASDNASGVAVLLEVAQRLSEAGYRPKRTVAFAAFDAEEEMLLGSCAFSTRPDVEQAKIVGVVNVDMLGRDFLDTVKNTVFAAGTEGYPALEKRVQELGTEAGIRVLPIGTDLIGPRSDHAPFESLDIPCVFFSCGTFGDYHVYLNYHREMMDGQKRLVAELVKHPPGLLLLRGLPSFAAESSGIQAENGLVIKLHFKWEPGVGA